MSTYFVKGQYWDIYHQSHDKKHFQIVIEAKPSELLSKVALKIANDGRTDFSVTNIIKL